MIVNVFQKKREEIEFTQEQLAQKLATDRSTVAKWETGKSFPRPDMLVKLTEVFGCTADELLGINRDKQTQPETAVLTVCTTASVRRQRIPAGETYSDGATDS